ncbi:Predicted cysteine protease (OTU family) [Legionella hackeliae]|uniref:OTU domain-containing protein n=1 Tax=Legionella hackeliae TaxID=449 RepID=UPI000E1AEA92|nr:OTU domain-containing protein [Legionella hackeliae]STX48890.1 Predicted cysteine protease (OTU family) [Legionella hackeliae]
MPATRFFGNLSQQKTQATHLGKKSVHYVDVGGNGDCGFRAITAALISKILFENRNSPELAALLHEHFKYFPDQKPRLALATPVEQLRWMTESSRMATSVQSLAYTIRQLTVDEMVAHPENYRGAFIGVENMPTSPEAMRQASTWIDETAIAAAAKVTGFPIDVRVVTEGRELPMRLRYPAKPQTATSPLVIQLQDKHYIPGVRNAAQFHTVKSAPVRTLEPKQLERHDPELKDILAKIKAEDDRILKHFEDIKTRLTAAVEADGATKEVLLNIYIEGLKKGDYLQGYVGFEHGSEHFFKVLRDSRSDLQVVRSEFENPNKHFTTQLVHAIARAVSINQLDGNEVFDKVETSS